MSAATLEAPAPSMKKFKVLHGQHTGWDKDGKVFTIPQGGIVETEIDLHAICDQQGVQPKFQRLDEYANDQPELAAAVRERDAKIHEQEAEIARLKAMFEKQPTDPLTTSPKENGGEEKPVTKTGFKSK